jgi:6-phosphofructokinase 1
MTDIKTIGFLTSGGDAPGMNPCIRAVTRTSLYYGLKPIGVREGYEGLLRGNFEPLGPRQVGGILQTGGTILQTARCAEFKTEKGLKEAIRQINRAEIDGIIVIGGYGSMRGAHALAEAGIPTVGIPASIDNDIWGTNMAIGVDTALNTIRNAIDQLRDTAYSHNRAFLVETMGRNCGYLAVMGGVIGGAEMILAPEREATVEEVAATIEAAYKRGKTHAIVVVSEGASIRTTELADRLNEMDVGFKTRVTILGHVQRGGRPSAFDRLLATRMGVKAVEALKVGQSGVMVALQGRDIANIPLADTVGKQREANLDYYDMARMLAN